MIWPGLPPVAIARTSFAALILSIAAGSSEPGALVVRVIENTNLVPLRNAEVIDLDSRSARFTDDSASRVSGPDWEGTGSSTRRRACYGGFSSAIEVRYKGG